MTNEQLKQHMRDALERWMTETVDNVDGPASEFGEDASIRFQVWRDPERDSDTDEEQWSVWTEHRRQRSPHNTR